MTRRTMRCFVNTIVVRDLISPSYSISYIHTPSRDCAVSEPSTLLGELCAEPGGHDDCLERPASSYRSLVIKNDDAADYALSRKNTCYWANVYPTSTVCRTWQ